jgi:hypothetical protein
MTGIGSSARLQREEAMARLRSECEAHLTRVEAYRRGRATPRCYLSRAPGRNQCAADLVHDLQGAGVYIVEDAAQVQPDDYIIVLDTPAYQKAWKTVLGAFETEKELVRARIAAGSRRLINIVLDNQPGAIALHELKDCTLGNLCDPTHYPVSLFDLVLTLYAIPFTHTGFAPLRESLHQQWEQMAGETS